MIRSCYTETQLFFSVYEFSSFKAENSEEASGTEFHQLFSMELEFKFRKMRRICRGRERERERERECVNEPFWFLVGLLWIYTRVETRSWCVDADVRFGNKMTPRRNVTGQWGVRAVKRRTKASRVKRFCTLVTHGLSDFIIAPNDVNTLSISRGRNFRLAVSFAPVCVSNKFKSVVLFIYNL